jgi:polyferredoxin
LFDLWGSPWWTAWLIVGYFAAALLVDALFKNASFCKYVCPIGQFNFAASTVSPLEVKVRDHGTCSTCQTVDCIRGTRAPDDEALVLQRGCELALFQPSKVGNMDCTFCLDCVYACPHDNIAIETRLPGSELWEDTRRAGVGRFSKRTDLAILALLFTFGALLNAFGMVSPVYAVQSWLAERLGTTHEAPVLGTLFFIALVVEPVLLIGGAAYLTRWATKSSDKLLVVTTRFAYALIPLGFGVWLSHYSFHLLTGLWTFVPVVQQALLDLGISVLGNPAWQLAGMPKELVLPLEFGFLGLGALGSMLVAYRIAARDYPERPVAAFVPWAVLSLMLWLAALWLLNQPMEMRGTFLGS